MRTLLLTTLSLIVFNLSVNAQYINSLSIYPANPTTNDSIYLIASCYFQSGTCDQKTLNYSIINETIDCDALHCIGMLTYICYDEDTFSIGKLPAGNYNYRYFVNAGFGFNPCTPGIVPGPSDSLNFTVTTASGISNPSYQEFIFGPNPCSDFLEIKYYSNEEKQVAIIDMTGKICLQEVKAGNNIQISTNDIASGLYLLKSQSKTTNYQSKLFYKK
jgi:hypothetical protein